MKPSKTLKIILMFAGLAGLIVGAGMLFVPIPFHSSSGIVINDNANLMNEMRASGGALFASALVILSGAFISRLTFTATVIAAVMYLSYGVSRLISIALDGMPDIALLQITGFEIIVGLICSVSLLSFRDKAITPFTKPSSRS